MIEHTQTHDYRQSITGAPPHHEVSNINTVYMKGNIMPKTTKEMMQEKFDFLVDGFFDLVDAIGADYDVLYAKSDDEMHAIMEKLIESIPDKTLQDKLKKDAKIKADINKAFRDRAIKGLEHGNQLINTIGRNLVDYLERTPKAGLSKATKVTDKTIKSTSLKTTKKVIVSVSVRPLTAQEMQDSSRGAGTKEEREAANS